MIGMMLAGVVVAAVGSTPPVPKPPSTLASHFEEVRARLDLPAIAGFAMRAGEIVAIEAVGVRARGDETVVTTGDRWHLGSCGKAMSATVLDRLVQRGDLAWDMTIGDAFGDLEEVLPGWHSVTLRRLVLHRSGLPEDAREPLLALRMMPLETPLPDQRLELVRLVLSDPPVESDGSGMRYSNFGYAIAAAIAERRTGRDWESLCREFLFDPLEMSETGFGAPGSMEALDEPRGHRNGIPVPPSRFADNPPAISAAGTIHATMTDWSKFLAAHLHAARGEPGPFDAGRLQSLQRPPEGGEYASGWAVVRRPWAPGPIFMHNGSNTLWFAVVWMSPARDWVMAALTNEGGPKAARACDEVIGVLIDHLDRLDAAGASSPPEKTGNDPGSK